MSLLPNSKLEELIIEGYSQYAAIFEDFIGIPKSLKKLQAPHFYTMDIETYKYQLDNLTILIDDLCNKKILNDWQSGNLGSIPWYRSSSIYNLCYYIADNKINIIKDTDSHIEYDYIFEDI